MKEEYITLVREYVYKKHRYITNRDKVARILAVLARIHRPIVYKSIEDIEYGCSEAELDFYYFWIVMRGVS